MLCTRHPIGSFPKSFPCYSHWFLHCYPAYLSLSHWLESLSPPSHPHCKIPGPCQKFTSLSLSLHLNKPQRGIHTESPLFFFASACVPSQLPQRRLLPRVRSSSLLFVCAAFRRGCSLDLRAHLCWHAGCKPPHRPISFSEIGFTIFKL